MKSVFRSLFSLLLIAVIAGFPNSAHADVAPPSHPPGSNPGPDAETTQVRMISETVLLEVLAAAPKNSLGRAKVTADFIMRNLGTDAESMGVRFPISSNNGFGEYPEITDLGIKVDGNPVPTRRIMEEDPMWGSDPVPWAEFDVTFPPSRDVHIQVAYLIEGTGEYPFAAFYYVFHTGAGWKDSIGSADLIVRFPYEANLFNVIFEEEIGWSTTTPGGVIGGREIRWHFENLEPDRSSDFQLSLVMPSAWQKVLTEQANVQKDPNDGEAWGRLGKLYKEMFFFRRGFRHDPGGDQLYGLSIQAYEKAVVLLPDDALWHAGFSDLLAVHAYYSSQENEDARAEMLRSMQEIWRALELSPNDPKVKEIAEKIYYLFPDAIQQLESGYDFLWLTATPVFSTPTLALDQPTPTPQPPPAASFTPTVIPATETKPAPETAPSGNPFCGSAVLVPLALVWFMRRKRNHLL